MCRPEHEENLKVFKARRAKERQSQIITRRLCYYVLISCACVVNPLQRHTSPKDYRLNPAIGKALFRLSIHSPNVMLHSHTSPRDYRLNPAIGKALHLVMLQFTSASPMLSVYRTMRSSRRVATVPGWMLPMGMPTTRTLGSLPMSLQ